MVRSAPVRADNSPIFRIHTASYFEFGKEKKVLLIRLTVKRTKEVR